MNYDQYSHRNYFSLSFNTHKAVNNIDVQFLNLSMEMLLNDEKKKNDLKFIIYSNNIIKCKRKKHKKFNLFC